MAWQSLFVSVIESKQITSINCDFVCTTFNKTFCAPKSNKKRRKITTTNYLLACTGVWIEVSSCGAFFVFTASTRASVCIPHFFGRFLWRANCLLQKVYTIITIDCVTSVDCLHSKLVQKKNTHRQTFVSIFSVDAFAQALRLVISLELVAIAGFLDAVTFAFRVLFHFD